MPVALRSHEIPVVLDAMQTHGKYSLPAFRPKVSNQKYSTNFPVSKLLPNYCSILLHCPETSQKHARKLLSITHTHLSCKNTLIIYREGIAFGHSAWWQCTVVVLKAQQVLVLVLSIAMWVIAPLPAWTWNSAQAAITRQIGLYEIYTINTICFAMSWQL